MSLEVSYRARNTLPASVLVGAGVALALIGATWTFTTNRVTTLSCERRSGHVECEATEPALLSNLSQPVAHDAWKVDVFPDRHGARLSISGAGGVLEFHSGDTEELQAVAAALRGYLASTDTRFTRQLVREQVSLFNVAFYALGLLAYVALVVLGERRVRVRRDGAQQYVVESRSWVGGSVLGRLECERGAAISDEMEVVKQRVASRAYQTFALGDDAGRLVLPAPSAAELEAVRAALSQLVSEPTSPRK